MKKLIAEVQKEYRKERAERVFYVEKGFRQSWAEEHREPGDDGIKNYSTATRWKQYVAGEIDRPKAVELATKRALQAVQTEEERKLKRIELAELAPVLSSLSISVGWVKSKTWGANPHATIRAYDTAGRFIGEYKGTASGCGYDKESAAIAEALNQCASALQVLYLAEEKRLKMRKAEGKDTSRGEVIGYASGYGVLPYFEGGCGYSCFEHIFKKQGFICKHTASGKMFDSYYIERR